MSTPFPKFEEREVWFGNWYGGMSNVDDDFYATSGQGSYIQSAAIWEEQPYLKPQRSNAAKTTGLFP